jgi:hypothetical protein
MDQEEQEWWVREVVIVAEMENIHLIDLMVGMSLLFFSFFSFLSFSLLLLQS